MWQQQYTPINGSLALSTLVAALPIFVILFMLGILRQSAWISALARNPAAESKFRAIGFIGAAFAEFVFLGCLVISFILIYAVKG